MAQNTMQPWVFMAEWWYDQLSSRGVEYFLDGWEDAGYETIMFGRLDLLEGDKVHPSFAPDLALYQETSLRPPELPPHLAAASDQLKKAMEAVKKRGFGVCLFSPDPYLAIGPDKALFDFTSPDCVNYYHARLRDAYQNYPMADRILMDGPEWSYEPQAFQWRKQTIFNELDERPSVRAKAIELGYDFDRIVRSLRHFEAQLGQLASVDLERFLAAQKGSLDGMDLLLLDRGLADWFQFRHDAMRDFMASLGRVVKQLKPDLKLGLGPRLPTWARLTGCSLKSIATVTDFQAPKIYLWKGGFDGYYGTLRRYVEYLMAVNPNLPEALFLDFLYRFLGIELPDVRNLADFDRPFPPSYFDITLANEIRKINADVSDLSEIVPYVEAGPHPHAGDPIGIDEFKKILSTMQREGLTRFIHYWHGEFDDEVRAVRAMTH